MKPQFLQKFSDNFLLWFQNYLNKYAETYQTQEVTFRNNGKHPRYPALISYVSDFSQINADTSLPGTVAPIYIGEEGTPQNLPSWFKAGMIDYRDGTLLVPANLPQQKDFVVECSPQEYSVFYSPLTEGEIIMSTLEDRQKKMAKDDKLFPTPVIALCVDMVENNPLALGGLVETTVYAKAIIFADDPFFLDGALSVLQDSVDKAFGSTGLNLSPFDKTGVLKNAQPYNYDELQVQSDVNSYEYYVEKAIASKTNDLIRRGAIPNLKIGFVEFEISKGRYKRDY